MEQTVLEAAHKANVKIPTLCFLKDINETANCRICVVDCGGRTLQAACVLPVTPGMVVKTNTPAVREARRMNLELILSNHDKKCLTCVRSENCELQTLCKELGVENSERFAGARNEYEVDSSSDSIVRNNNKCILCRRCVGACANRPRDAWFQDLHRKPLQLEAGSDGLHQLRTVHHRLPRGRSDREGRYRGRLGRVG